MDFEYGAPFSGRKLERLKEFLKGLELDYDAGVEYTVNLVDGEGEIVATGSLQSNVLKCIGVSQSHQGEGLAAVVVTELVKQAFQKGERHLFLFTKPKNRQMFADLNFYPVAATEDSLLMENVEGGAKRFTTSLECPTKTGIIGAIVANCNPFTYGHRYLVETAAAQCDLVHLFILSENLSLFPNDVRFRLAREGVEDLRNVVVHTTGSYLVSAATFPTYFIKDKERVDDIRCALDLKIFADYFAKACGITKRFVGTEPLSPVTNVYNRQMKEYLPKRGIEVIEIPRRELDGGVISASRVRALMKEGNLEEIRRLVPMSTFREIQRMMPEFHG